MNPTSSTLAPIFLVVGPPAVGKSTTSRALAAHFPRSIHIPVDNMRDMVVSGLELPGAVWTDEMTRQVSLARISVVHMALTYRQAGFAVVMDDFWDPGRLADYVDLFALPAVHRVTLFPAQGQAHQRNLQRSGDTPARAYIDEGIRIVYKELNAFVPQLAGQGWVVLDTSELSVEASVAAILQRTLGAG